MKSLAIVLRDTEDLVESRQLTVQQEKNKKVILEGCQEVLAAIDERLLKFSDIDINKFVEDGKTQVQSKFIPCPCPVQSYSQA